MQNRFPINLGDGGARTFCSFQRVIAFVGGSLADVPRCPTDVPSHAANTALSLCCLIIYVHTWRLRNQIPQITCGEKCGLVTLEPSCTQGVRMCSYTELNESRMIFICEISLKTQLCQCVRAPNKECKDKCTSVLCNTFLSKVPIVSRWGDCVCSATANRMLHLWGKILRESAFCSRSWDVSSIEGYYNVQCTERVIISQMKLFKLLVRSLHFILPRFLLTM